MYAAGGRQERDDDRVDRVVDAAGGQADHPAHGQAHDDAADRDHHQADPAIDEREHAGQRGRDGEPVGDQRRGVVDQRLALEDRHDLARHPEALEDARGGDGIRRGHDRAERERRRPAQTGDERLGHDRDHHRREQHETHREEADRAHVRPDVADGGEVAGTKQDRRQEQQEDDVRLQLDCRQTRHEPQQEPAEDQQDRVRNPDPARDDGQRGGREEQESTTSIAPIGAWPAVPSTPPTAASDVTPGRSPPGRRAIRRGPRPGSARSGRPG